jgi:thiol-disulfide isomerase/thioredoxin
VNRNALSLLCSLVFSICTAGPVIYVVHDHWNRPTVIEQPVRPIHPIHPIRPHTPPRPVQPVRPVDKHHLLVFHADWCGVCQRVKPVVNQLEASGVIVDRINYDEHPDIASKYHVTSLPTFILNPGAPNEVVTNDIEVIIAHL